VSVCGTGTVHLARGFSWQYRRNPLGGTVAPPDHHLSVSTTGDLPPVAPYRLGRLTPLGLPPCVPPSLMTGHCGTGILTCCPSPTPVGLGLGPTHPQLISMAAEPLALLIPTFALVVAPAVLPLDLPCGRQRSPTTQSSDCIRGFGAGLEPRYIVGARARSTSELLRTLSRMAASKPTSWLSLRSNILAHLDQTWGP
jgi:hypothetical protein